jgi:hypothetical protein
VSIECYVSCDKDGNVIDGRLIHFKEGGDGTLVYCDTMTRSRLRRIRVLTDDELRECLARGHRYCRACQLEAGIPDSDGGL